MTVSGTMKDLRQTKDYTMHADARRGLQERKVTVKLVQLTSSEMTISQGGFAGTLPMPGVSGKKGYLLEGNKLYLTNGHRGADGLGDWLSHRHAVR